MLSARLNSPAHGQVIIGLLREKASAFEALQLAGRMLKEARSARPRRVALATLGLDSGASRRALEALLAASLSAAFELPSFKSAQSDAAMLSEITLFDPDAARLRGDSRSQRRQQSCALAHCSSGQRAHAGVLSRTGRGTCRGEGWRVQFFDRRQLERRGAGAFLAVTQGSEDEAPASCMSQYRGVGRSSAPKLALVGKGICFDTGGTNLKTHKSMLDMHIDMGGSAVALGTLLALTRLKVPYRIDCWLAIAENRIGPKAYKPQDVVTASNGTSIQVIHTDAEGRMVLADTLVFAAREAANANARFCNSDGCLRQCTHRALQRRVH